MSEQTTDQPDAGDAVDQAQPDAGPNLQQRQAAWDELVRRGQERVDELSASVTQREWLNITGKLDRTRDQIASDSNLSLLALAWVKELHEHGGASWDRFLDMTDEQLAEYHGLPVDERPTA